MLKRFFRQMICCAPDDVGSAPPAPPAPPQPDDGAVSGRIYAALVRKAAAAEIALDAANKDREKLILTLSDKEKELGSLRKSQERAALNTALEEAAKKTGFIDPGLLSAMLPDLRVGSDGKIAGLDEAIAKLKMNKPHLFSQTTSHAGQPPGAAPPSGKRAKDMSDAERAAAWKSMTGKR